MLERLDGRPDAPVGNRAAAEAAARGLRSGARMIFLLFHHTTACAKKAKRGERATARRSPIQRREGSS